MKIIWNSELYHYGMPRRSGRYKWGSGENPYHHGMDTPRRLIKKYDKLNKKLELNKKRTASAFRTPYEIRRDNKFKNIAAKKAAAPIGSSKRDRLSKKYWKAEEKSEKDRIRVNDRFDKMQQKIVNKMNDIDDTLNKQYMRNVDKNDLKRGKQYLDDLDEMSYNMSRAMEIDYPAAREVSKSLEKNDVVYYTDGRNRLSVVEKKDLKNLKDMNPVKKPKSGRYHWDDAGSSYRQKIEKASNNFDKDFKGKTPSVATVMKKYDLDYEGALDILEEKRYW